MQEVDFTDAKFLMARQQDGHCDRAADLLTAHWNKSHTDLAASGGRIRLTRGRLLDL